MSVGRVSAGFAQCSFSTTKDAYYLISIEPVRAGYNPMDHQKQFMMLAWAFSAYLLVNLAYLWRKEYDFGGKITEVDEKDWEKKGILRFKVDGKKTVLDAWHHEGMKELREKILKNEIGG